MTPGRETAAGFFVARRVAAIRWKNGRRGAFWLNEANKPARRERAFAKTAEPLHELCKARLRPCPVFVLLCPVIQGQPPSPSGRAAAPISCFHPMGYEEAADAGLCPLFLFFSVIYRERVRATAQRLSFC
jgi:hypothetical protein